MKLKFLLLLVCYNIFSAYASSGGPGTFSFSARVVLGQAITIDGIEGFGHVQSSGMHAVTTPYLSQSYSDQYYQYKTNSGSPLAVGNHINGFDGGMPGSISWGGLVTAYSQGVKINSNIGMDTQDGKTVLDTNGQLPSGGTITTNSNRWSCAADTQSTTCTSDDSTATITLPFHSGPYDFSADINQQGAAYISSKDHTYNSTLTLHADFKDLTLFPFTVQQVDAGTGAIIITDTISASITPAPPTCTVSVPASLSYKTGIDTGSATIPLPVQIDCDGALQTDTHNGNAGITDPSIERIGIQPSDGDWWGTSGVPLLWYIGSAKNDYSTTVSFTVDGNDISQSSESLVPPGGIIKCEGQSECHTTLNAIATIKWSKPKPGTLSRTFIMSAYYN
ncbi:hypothetical protein [Citrobacter werkmanii]|uniref:hypothetical protein n=1 Tax=Citrobacter werkmanii TaxID=67827 RepID=UPI00300C8A57